MLDTLEMTVNAVARYMIDHLASPEECDSDHDMYYADSLAEDMMVSYDCSFEFALAWIKEHAQAIVRELDFLGYAGEWVWHGKTEDSVFYVFFGEEDYEVDEEWGLF